MPELPSIDRKRKTAGAATLLLPDKPPTLADETIEKIVEQLLAAGVKLDDIVMPGSAANAILFIADDFDAPTSDFSDYM